jgi:hypothetical protein
MNLISRRQTWLAIKNMSDTAVFENFIAQQAARGHDDARR